MRKNQHNVLSGQELAKILPTIHKMRKNNISCKEIGYALNIGLSTVSMYDNGYKDFLQGRKTKNSQSISRAIPYLNNQQMQIAIDKNDAEINAKIEAIKLKENYKLISDFAASKNVKQKSLSILWGFFKLNW